MNIRNQVGAFTILGFMIWGFGSMALGAILLRPAHIKNQAVEKCMVTSGDDEDVCKARVKQMTQSQRIEFIRDI